MERYETKRYGEMHTDKRETRQRDMEKYTQIKERRDKETWRTAHRY